MMPIDSYFTSAEKGRYGSKWRGASVNGNLPKTPKEPKKRARKPVELIFPLDTDKP